MEINLLPWRDEIVAFNKKLLMRLIMMAIILAGIFLFVISRVFFAETNYEKNYIATLSKAKADIVNSISGYLNDKKMQEELATRLLTLRKLQVDRFSTVRLLNVLSKITPRGVYFSKLARSGNTVDLSGSANSNLLIAQFMRAVDDSPELDVISLEKVEKKEGKNTIVTNFDLKVVLTMSGQAQTAAYKEENLKLHNPIDTLKKMRDEKDKEIETISNTGKSP